MIGASTDSDVRCPALDKRRAVAQPIDTPVS
jgi:hypothetical protein